MTKAKPLDLSHVLRHAFLAGVAAARNIPPGDECDGQQLWLDYDPDFDNFLSARRVRDALYSLETAGVLQWQPMSTAPRDGTWFIAFASVDGIGQTRIVRFADKYDRLPTDETDQSWSRVPTLWLPIIEQPVAVRLTEI